MGMNTNPSIPTNAHTAKSLPDRTEDDGKALFESVKWFDTQEEAGKLEEYRGKFVAVFGQKILDADVDENELLRRLDQLDESIPENRVLIRYLYAPGESVL